MLMSNPFLKTQYIYIIKVPSAVLYRDMDINIQFFLRCVQCPGGAFTPDIQTTKEFPDDVVTFVRNHPVMFNPIYPVGRRPLVVRTNAEYRYTSVAVDQVMAADGNYQVLFLGTGENGTKSSHYWKQFLFLVFVLLY